MKQGDYFLWTFARNPTLVSTRKRGVLLIGVVLTRLLLRGSWTMFPSSKTYLKVNSEILSHCNVGIIQGLRENWGTGPKAPLLHKDCVQVLVAKIYDDLHFDHLWISHY